MALPAKLQADVNFRRGLAAAAGVSVLALAAIVIFLLSQALPIFAHISLKIFFSQQSGIRRMIRQFSALGR